MTIERNDDYLQRITR